MQSSRQRLRNEYLADGDDSEGINMGLLISDNLQPRRADTKFEAALVKILQTKISFKFRRGNADGKPLGFGLPAIRYQLLRVVRAD